VTEGMRLPDCELAVHLRGFRSSIGKAGVKIDIYLPPAALTQLLDHGVTGGVAGSNLRIELEGAEFCDQAGQLSLAEVVILAEGLDKAAPARGRNRS
jgi:hypothetical protein